MRDLSNHEKNEAAKLNKQVEKLNNDLNNLQKDKERLEGEIAQQQEKMIDLHEQVTLWIFTSFQCVNMKRTLARSCLLTCHCNDNL